MSQTIEFGDDRIVECATEKELLEFANKLRTAGHADPLEALLPSTQEDPSSCLIARACNFSSQVVPTNNYDKERVQEWNILLSIDEDEQIVQAIAAVCQSGIDEVVDDYNDPVYSISLPAHIGTAAEAFDAGLAFEEYAI